MKSLFHCLLPRHLATLLFTLWLATFSSLWAESGNPRRTCRIVYLAAPTGAPETLFLFDGEKSRQVDLPRLGFSEVYALPSGDVQIALLPEAVQAAAPGKASPVPAGAPTAALPAAMQDVYLLLTHDPENPVAPVKIRVIDADPGQFRRGQQLWYNLTPNLVGGLLGSQKVRFEPNSRKVIDAPTSSSGAYPVNLFHLPPGKQQTYPICETQWIADPTARSVFFIIMVGNKRTPNIIGMFDARKGKDSDAGKASSSEAD